VEDVERKRFHVGNLIVKCIVHRFEIADPAQASAVHRRQLASQYIKESAPRTWSASDASLENGLRAIGYRKY
jgi:hypothetical protein